MVDSVSIHTKLILEHLGCCFFTSLLSPESLAGTRGNLIFALAHFLTVLVYLNPEPLAITHKGYSQPLVVFPSVQPTSVNRIRRCEPYHLRSIMAQLG